MAAIRFYLDENVPLTIAEQLKRRHIDVFTVRDLDELGDDDELSPICQYPGRSVDLPAIVAHTGAIIAFHASDAAQARLHYLLDANREGTLSPEERATIRLKQVNKLRCDDD